MNGKRGQRDARTDTSPSVFVLTLPTPPEAAGINPAVEAAGVNPAARLHPLETGCILASEVAPSVPEEFFRGADATPLA